MPQTLKNYYYSLCNHTDRVWVTWGHQINQIFTGDTVDIPGPLHSLSFHPWPIQFFTPQFSLGFIIHMELQLGIPNTFKSGPSYLVETVSPTNLVLWAYYSSTHEYPTIQPTKTTLSTHNLTYQENYFFFSQLTFFFFSLLSLQLNNLLS